jgi:hypothetical protein
MGKIGTGNEGQILNEQHFEIPKKKPNRIEITHHDKLVLNETSFNA